MIFPHPLSSDEDGLLAVGGNLHISTLISAYSWGIFPWYSQAPIMWWFTHPRCVLYPKDVRVSKSMKALSRKSLFDITINKDFAGVISGCAFQKREDQESTWITNEMIDAYLKLHEKGIAHSVEVCDKESQSLAGGLYGLCLGKIFYGESMFSKVSNTSKLALIHLCSHLVECGVNIIDCQQKTEHLISMGAQQIGKTQFYDILKSNLKYIGNDYFNKVV